MTTGMKRVKVALFGLGPIGLETLRLAATSPGLEIVGAVDSDPAKAGRTLTELTGLGSLDGLNVAGDLEELFRDTPPDLILHAASSHVLEALPQIRPALELGVSVVSSCEELVYPALKALALSKEIDGLCRHTGARVVATGATPGFVMDVLPLCLTGVCQRVDRIRVQRRVAAGMCRRSLQKKIGCGEDRDAFAEKLRQGGAGHAGLPESVALIAHALGWNLDDIRQEGEPVLAMRAMESEFFNFPSGRVCGIHQRAFGLLAGESVIELDLRIALGEPAPSDRIVIEGTPSVEVNLPRGIAGDAATVAALINTVPRLLATAPGLHLPIDLSLPRLSGSSDYLPRFFRV